MYNHYIPGSNGIYRRHSVPVAEHCSEPFKETQNNPGESCRTQRPVQTTDAFRPDIGDLLLLCITILLLIDAEESDTLTILIAIAAFVFHL